LTDEITPPINPSIPSRQQPLEPIAEALTSRAADHLFWVGRYLERTDGAARLLRTILLKYRDTVEFEDSLDSECLTVLLPALTHVTATYPGFTSNQQNQEGQQQQQRSVESLENKLLALARDSKLAGSLTNNIQLLVQSAFNIRDLWSQDTWRSIDNIQHRWQQKPLTTLEPLQSHLDELMTGLVAFTGLTNESMTREAGWLMLDSGRRLERALVLMTLLRATLVNRYESTVLHQILEAVLVSTDSFTIYQRRYRGVIQLPMLLELLLFDTSHPRSVAYQLYQLSQHIGALPRESCQTRLSEEERLILKAYTDLRLSSCTALLKTDDSAGIYSELDQLLANTTDLLWRIAEVIAQAYFNHAQATQLMAAPVLSEDEL
jgi:uncharacterized alpha-E superfamily protein